jgi:hypothetical protein
MWNHDSTRGDSEHYAETTFKPIFEANPPVGQITADIFSLFVTYRFLKSETSTVGFLDFQVTYSTNGRDRTFINIVLKYYKRNKDHTGLELRTDSGHF